MLLKLLKYIIRKEELFFFRDTSYDDFFLMNKYSRLWVCLYTCYITLVSSIYHVSLYLIKENPYYNWYPVIVLWNHLGWLSWIILAHKSTSLRIYIQAFVNYAYIMLIGLDVTMAKRKSIVFIFRKQCNESKKIQRDVITEDIHWCALNVSRLSNGNL